MHAGALSRLHPRRPQQLYGGRQLRAHGHKQHSAGIRTHRVLCTGSRQKRQRPDGGQSEHKPRRRRGAERTGHLQQSQQHRLPDTPGRPFPPRPQLPGICRGRCGEEHHRKLGRRRPGGRGGYTHRPGAPGLHQIFRHTGRQRKADSVRAYDTLRAWNYPKEHHPRHRPHKGRARQGGQPAAAPGEHHPGSQAGQFHQERWAQLSRHHRQQSHRRVQQGPGGAFRGGA